MTGPRSFNTDDFFASDYPSSADTNATPSLAVDGFAISSSWETRMHLQLRCNALVAEQGALAQQVQHLQRSEGELKQKNNSLAENVSALTQQLNEKKAELAEVAKQLAELTDQHKTLGLTHARFKSDLECSQRDYKEQGRLLVASLGELEILKQQKSQLENDAKKQQAEWHTQFKLRQRENAEKLAALLQFATAGMQQNSLLDRNTVDPEEFLSEMEDMQRRLNVAESKAENLASEIAKSAEEEARQKAAFATLQNENSELKAQIEKLTAMSLPKPLSNNASNGVKLLPAVSSDSQSLAPPPHIPTSRSTMASTNEIFSLLNGSHRPLSSPGAVAMEIDSEVSKSASSSSSSSSSSNSNMTPTATLNLNPSASSSASLPFASLSGTTGNGSLLGMPFLPQPDFMSGVPFQVPSLGMSTSPQNFMNSFSPQDPHSLTQFFAMQSNSNLSMPNLSPFMLSHGLPFPTPNLLTNGNGVRNPGNPAGGFFARNSLSSSSSSSSSSNALPQSLPAFVLDRPQPPPPQYIINGMDKALEAAARSLTNLAQSGNDNTSTSSAEANPARRAKPKIKPAPKTKSTPKQKAAEKRKAAELVSERSANRPRRG